MNTDLQLLGMFSTSASDLVYCDEQCINIHIREGYLKNTIEMAVCHSCHVIYSSSHPD
jgi:hypothetical protein